MKHRSFKKLAALFMLLSFIFATVSPAMATSWSDSGAGMGGIYVDNGSGNDASGEYSTAMGYDTTASGEDSTAMGFMTTASESYSTAMGEGTKAKGKTSTAMGHYTNAIEWASTAMGMETNAREVASTAMGYASNAAGNGSFAGGGYYKNPTTNAAGGAAYGTSSFAFGIGAVAGDASDPTKGYNAISMGYETTASGNYSTSMGYQTNASGEGSTAMGYKTTASGDDSTAMGYGTGAYGNYSTAMGNSTTASGVFSTATGADTFAKGTASFAAGIMSNAAGNSSFAGGGYLSDDWTTELAGGTAYGTSSFAFGIGAVAGVSGDTTDGGQIALGNGALAKGANTIALGNNANTSTFTNSVALGAGSTVTANDTIAVGSTTTQRKITGLADGSIAVGSHEAVTGNQLNATNVNVATNAANIATNTADIATINSSEVMTSGITSEKVAQIGTNATDITALKGNFETDGTTAKIATKAAQDANGNVIADTYATKTSVYTKDETYTKEEVDAKIDAGGALAVNYKDNTKAEIELMGADGTTISNVKEGQISAASTEAVNGSQLFATNQKVDEINGSAVMQSGITSEKVAKYDGYETAIANKANKATTLVGYGITDAYTKDEVDKKIASGIEVIDSKKFDEDNDQKASATGAGAFAAGYNNVAAGDKSTAVGYGNIVKGNGSGAFGDPNVISGNGSYAVGNNNTIEGDNNFVLGNNVKLGKGVKNTVAFGSLDPEKEMTVTESNTVAVGGRTISGLADGTNPTDAATVRQVDAVRNQLGSVSNEVREVGAISAALAGLHFAEPSGEEGDKLVGAIAYGGYRGSSAEAIGLAYKPSPNMMLSASTSISNGNDSQNAYNVGFSLKFGKGETAKTKAELQKQVKFVSDENQELKGVIKQLLERVKKLEESSGTKSAQ